ncbi:MAG TPA: Gfo/Idh/MocA family oxidoreductase [Thioalkalivibrio sp.]|nr:Gfo/Idh/MocA family oxidoreductase [Thioalkalivibrio sp.]
MAIGIGTLGFAHGHVGSYLAQWRDRPELGVRALAGWDHDAERLGTSAEQFGLDSVADARELLAREDIEAVVIAAETARHAGLVEQAAAAGKAIILQKPMALTMAEADRIVSAVNAAGVPFTMAWQMRVDPQNLQIKQLLESGALGRWFMLRRRHGLSMCLNDAFADSWHVDPAQNRDIWADDAAHPIDFIHWLLGVPEAVTAEIRTLHNPRMPMDNGIAIYHYPDGPLVEVCCSFTTRAAENTVEVIAENGTLVQNYGDAPSAATPRAAGACGLKWFLADEGEWVCSDIPSPDSQGVRIAALAAPLAEFLHGRRPALAGAEEGRTSLRMVLACYVSTREGRRVRLDDPAIDDV